MDRKLKRRLGNIALLALVLAAIVFFLLALKMYLANLDSRVAKLLKETDSSYLEKQGEVDYNGFFVAEVKDNLMKTFEDKEVNSVTYNFEGEPFYLELSIEENDVGEKSVSITKIVNETKDISASMNMKGLVSVAYRTGNKNQSSVLKITTDYGVDYFAMTDGTYYFLGADVENVSYKDGQFYHMSYNQDYLYLEELKSCSKEAQAQIDGFNMNDYYYRYGKINFLEEYYQKLASKTYKVADKCEEFKVE